MTKPTEQQRKWALKLARKLGIPYEDVIERYWGDDGPPTDDIAEDLRDLREDLLAQLDYAVPVGSTHDSLVPGSLLAELSALLNDVALLRAALNDEDALYDDVNALTPKVNAIPRRLSDIDRAVWQRLQTEYDEQARRAEGQAPCGVLTAQIGRFEDQLKQAWDALSLPLSQANTKTAKEALDVLERLRSDIEAEILAMGGSENVVALDKAFGSDLDAVAKALGGADKLGALLGTFDAGALAALITELGGGAAGATALTQAISAFGDIGKAKAAIDDLGITDLKAMITAEMPVERVAEIYTGLGGPAMKALFGADRDLARADVVLQGFGGDTTIFLSVMKDADLNTNPKALLALLNPGANGDATTFATLMNGFHTPEKRADLGGLIGPGGLGTCPTVLGALARDTSGDGLIALGAAFQQSGQREALNKALTDGGLAPPGADAKCLAALFNKDGVDDDATKAKALADLLSGMTNDSRGQMKTMLNAGGLGAAPASFATLVHKGCGGTASGLNALLAATNSDAGRTGMNCLMADAGMDGTVKGGAACLAQIMQDAGTDETTRAAGFATLVKGFDKAIAGNFKTVLDKGGMADHPKVLGQLVVKGCTGDAAKLGALCTGIAGSTDAQANLKGLVDKGGFGARVDGGDATNTTPECLADLFETGCGGKPDEMVALLEVMGATQQTQMCALMKDGDLGQHPKVLANMYKHGCLKNNEADRNGKKDPDKLKSVLTAFDGKAALFKDMMGTGGFGAGGKETRLGSVLRYGFTNKSTGDAQPEKLEQMATAFNGHMGDLNTMLNAMETAPDHAMLKNTDEALQPGGGIQNILTWPKHAGNADKLKTVFFDKLNATTVPDPALVGQAVNRPLATLIQTAASFEKAPIPAARSHFMTAGGKRIDMRSDHILGRHTRKYQDFHQIKDHNTLFPVDVDSAKADAIGKVAVDGIPVVTATSGTRTAGFPGVLGIPNPTARKQKPPRDIYDLNSAASSWPKDGVTSGEGYTVKVGFKCSSVDPSRVMLDQLFPDDNAHADIEDINEGDMKKIKTALV